MGSYPSRGIGQDPKKLRKCSRIHNRQYLSTFDGPGHIRDIKSAGNVAYPYPPPIDQDADHVKLVGILTGAMPVHPHGGGADELPLFADADRLDWRAERLATTRLDLHKGHDVPTADNQIQVAVPAPKSVGHQRPAIAAQPSCRDALSLEPQCLACLGHGHNLRAALTGCVIISTRTATCACFGALAGYRYLSTEIRAVAHVPLPLPSSMTPSRSRAPGTAGAAVVLLALVYLFTAGVGPLPPVGPLLDPVHGLWATVRSAEHPEALTLPTVAVRDSVDVWYDDRGVPHIFARNTDDAYRALGFVIARDRLFQIDLQTRAGGGTLTELVGERALPVDQSTRALGMPWAAERQVALADTTTAQWRLLEAYIDGINSYVRQMAPRDWPLEYKLLGRTPRLFTPLDMFHVLNRMGLTLASAEDEIRRLHAAARIGTEAADALFPVHAPIVEPIQPNGQSSPRRDPVRIPAPGVPDPMAVALLQQLGGATTLAAGLPARLPDAVGSNNWAVAPGRSASGKALLAGDPHLELTLPSIWYEAHMVVPDTMDVYGVAIPGIHGIVIGFNRDVAWTFTNVGADVMDFYLETVDTPNAPSTYLLDGAQRPVDRRIEQYRTADGSVLREDTVYYTHRGPMRRVNDRWLSQRWTLLEGRGTESEGFTEAARATSAQALLDAMATHYSVPAQNMLVADRGGTIGIRSTGRYPIRSDSGPGDIIRDGSTSRSDWIGNWPVQDYPQSLNPAQLYLASANQDPLDPKAQPRYLGADWERPWRAIQINTLLRNNSAVSVDDMRRYQTEPTSVRAQQFVPAFIAAARARGGDPNVTTGATLLGDWDFRYTRENERAVLFEAAMTNLQQRLWDELRDTTVAGIPPIPSDMMTAVLLDEPENAWWDDRRTAVVERRDDILAESLGAAYDSLVRTIGAPTSGSWKWSAHRTATINHLLRLPSLGRRNIPVQGGIGLLNPSSQSGTHGASWRMVVELGDEVAAQAIYPGGQSGNPASTRYDDRIAAWTDGRLDSLRVPRRPDDLRDDMRRARLTFVPRSR